MFDYNHLVSNFKFAVTGKILADDEDKYPEAVTELLNLWSSPGRFYHTVEHLVDCLNVYVGAAYNPDFNPDVVMAIWFHDVVYNPRSSDNEERSVFKLFEITDKHQLNIPLDRLGYISKLILATKNHEATDFRMQDLLDTDLSILSAPRERYKRYARDIRKEYSWVPENTYIQERTRILQRFLATAEGEGLFKGKCFISKSAYNQQAIGNLRDEIQFLSGQFPKSE